MFNRKGHRTNWVDPRTAGSRYPTPLSKRKARNARDWIAEGRMTHAQAAAHYGCTTEELISAVADLRGQDSGHGNAVLNVKPTMRDILRDKFKRAGEAMHTAVERLWAEWNYYRTFALKHGCPPYSGLTPEPVLPPDQVIH